MDGACVARRVESKIFEGSGESSVTVSGPTFIPSPPLCEGQLRTVCLGIGMRTSQAASMGLHRMSLEREDEFPSLQEVGTKKQFKERAPAGQPFQG